MKTLDEIISSLENTPKRKGIRYVRHEDLTDAITCLKAFAEACDTLVRVADYMGVLRSEDEDA